MGGGGFGGGGKAVKRRGLISFWIREMQSLWAQEGREEAEEWGRFYAIQDKVKGFYMKEAEKFMLEMGARRRFLEEGPSQYFLPL